MEIPIRESANYAWLGFRPHSLGKASKIDRKGGVARLSAGATAERASSQARLVRRAKLGAEKKAEFANLALRYRASVKGLPIARINGKWLTDREVAKRLRSMSDLVLVNGGAIYDPDADVVLKWEFERDFEPESDPFFCCDIRCSWQTPQTRHPESIF